MVITATEFKANIGKYLSLTKEGEVEITITKNGKSIAKLTPIKENRAEKMKSIFGILPPDASLEQAREERLSKHERPD